MKVLITGAAGQLGSHLVFELSKVNWIELLVSDKRTLNIADAEQVSVYFQKHLPHVVINAAAFTNVDDAEGDCLRAFDINHLGAANVARSSAKYNCIMIQISTDYVFDGESERPYIEEDLPNPLNIYGASKLEGERAVIQYNSQHIILRTSWLFSDLGKNFYLTIQNLLTEKNFISVVDDQVGAPTFVPDLVRTIVHILERLHQEKTLEWGVYHYGGHPFTSWFGFAKEIQKAIHPKGASCEIVGVTTKRYDSKAFRPLYSCLNSSKACSYFFVTPSDWLAKLNEIGAKKRARHENH